MSSPTPPCPDLPLKRVDQRWAAYADADTLVLFDGGHLLHTDVAPHNIIISADGDAGGRAHLIDWAWPTQGPAWVDAAAWVVRLIDAGHTPAQAEAWATRLSTWRDAPPVAVAAFALANAAMWNDIAVQDPGADWKRRMAVSARRWSEHRVDAAQQSTEAAILG